MTSSTVEKPNEEKSSVHYHCGVRGSPLSKVSFLSYISFAWFTRTIYRSTKTILSVKDFHSLDIRLSASYLHKALSSNWIFQSSSKQYHSQSLTWCLIKSFWPWILTALILELLFMLTMLLPPLILNQILDFVLIEGSSWRGYFYAIILFVNKFIAQLLKNNLDFLLICTGAQLKSSLTGAVFRKVLRISVSTRKGYSSGSLTNLISVDVERIASFMMHCTYLIVAPLKIVLILYILWRYLGPACLASAGVIAILVPLGFYVSRFSGKFAERQMAVKDTRLKYMNEILNGMKVLKLYAWEIPFTARVSEARKKEVKLILYSLLCYVVIFFVLNCAPFLVAFAGFATFLLIDSENVLDPIRAFVSINLMDQLRCALFKIPTALSELMQSRTAVERLRKFFITEDTDPDAVGTNPDEGEVLTFRKVSSSWTKDEDCILKDIDLHVRKGDLIAVIGPVGSGKSSLLSAVLGEMCIINGTVDLKGSVAYVPQQAWILNRTVKENVVLEKPMKEEIYSNIIDKCCLKPDFEILPDGDRTEIGEKGVNLSGGQKQRISVARSVFQDKDIYLLDDPLSAVDVHVRKALFEDVIGNEGLLKNKTRLLVTHDVSVLSKVDVIISMKNGKIDEIGSYQDLVERRGSFADFVNEHASKAAEINSGILCDALSAESETSGKSVSKMPQFFNKDDVDEVKYRSKLIEEEKMEIGGVKGGVYCNYLRHVGILLVLPSIFFYIGFSTFEASANIWLSKWTAEAIFNGTQNSSSTVRRLTIYSYLGAGQVLCTIMGATFIVWGGTRASVKYHLQMLESIMKSPMSFFDSTPMGRIMNRFGSDMDVLDTQLIYSIETWLYALLSVFAAFVVIGINTPLFFAFLLPLAIVYFYLLKVHLNASRQIKRLETTSRSPVYSHFMESVQGVSSIKAYNIKDDFTEKLEDKLDTHILCYFYTGACNGWLIFWLDFGSSLIVLAVTLLALHSRDAFPASVVGLLITYALVVTDVLPLLIRMNAELENRSVSIERLDEYCKLKSEAPWSNATNDPKPEWPENGQITFNSYSTRYREDMDLVLKEVNLVVSPSEKVGIVGRTGAGKSSITLALFRIIEPANGDILIDDINISKIGLHALRSKLTIIPQDPVLFTGSVRFNLDPNKEHNDDDIWASLEQSNLKTFVSNLSGGLEHNLDEGGSNLSLGQRQLICLSRALLKKTKILVLDEATASVDMNTDCLIQSTIRSAFRDHTIITVAHRLKTVIDYDKIVVMDSGNIVEVGSPSDLMENKVSRFYDMSKDAGLI